MERSCASIQEIIKSIVILLRKNDEENWANHFHQLLINYTNSNAREEVVSDILNLYKGGMGSFTDLVLQKNFKMLVDENNELASLKHDLYNACLEYRKKL